MRDNTTALKNTNLYKFLNITMYHSIALITYNLFKKSKFDSNIIQRLIMLWMLLTSILDTMYFPSRDHNFVFFATNTCTG